MGYAQNSNGGGWLFDYGISDEVEASDFIWGSQIIDDPIISSEMLGFDVSCKDFRGSDNTCSRKRNRVESCAAPGTKACREKLRRDKLNDRFIELSSILDPGRPPKADKIAILSDATRRLNQLHVEAEKLKESIEALQDTIKSLKEEKSELKNEKARLKAEKERMEQMLKGIGSTHAFMPHPAAAFKTFPYPNYIPMGMWQWLPPSVRDTSQDHVLRPPVA